MNDEKIKVTELLALQFSFPICKWIESIFLQLGHEDQGCSEFGYGAHVK